METILDGLWNHQKNRFLFHSGVDCVFSWAQVRVEYVESVPRENRFVPEFSSHFYIRIAAAAAARFILEPKETEKKERNNEKRRIKAVGSKGFPR